MKTTRWILLATVCWVNAHEPVLAFYNPQNGRWLSRDPIGEIREEHLYRFSGNQPTGVIDVLGLYNCVVSCAEQCKWLYPQASGPCYSDCQKFQKTCPAYQTKPCGQVVTRAMDPHPWYGCPLDLITRMCIPHQFIQTSDGDWLAFGGNGSGADHWSATKTDIYPAVGTSCEDFAKCLKEFFAKMNAPDAKKYDPLENNCQTAVSAALAKCVGRLGRF